MEMIGSICAVAAVLYLVTLERKVAGLSKALAHNVAVLDDLRAAMRRIEGKLGGGATPPQAAPKGSDGP